MRFVGLLLISSTLNKANVELMSLHSYKNSLRQAW